MSQRLKDRARRPLDWLRLILGLCWLVLATLSGAAAEDVFPSMAVGPDVYTNVIILNKTRHDVFFQHAHGMANAKVKELDIPTQIKLGYQVELPQPTRLEKVIDHDMTSFEADPQVQAVEEIVVAQVGRYLERLDTVTSCVVVGIVVMFYLLFCYLCRCLCVKTNVVGWMLPLVWMPFFKQIPLLRAASMSTAWILINLVPPFFLGVYIFWCIKVVRNRGKKMIYSVMLLFPVTNVVAFLYLALSGTGREEKLDRNVISLGGASWRDAA